MEHSFCGLLRTLPKGSAAALKAYMGYNDSRMGFYADKQCDLKHWGHEKGHFLCGWRCELRAKEILKISSKALFSAAECLPNDEGTR